MGRTLLEPAIPDRGRRSAVRSIRRIAVPAAGIVAAILLGSVPAGAGVNGSGNIAAIAPAARPAPTASPGTDTGVQRWFKAREGDQIELNNALDVAKHLPRARGRATPICTRLATIVLAVSRRSPAPVAQLESPLRAGLAEFGQGAAACLAGDLTRAEQLIAAGLAARVAADDQLDAILDGA